MVALFVRVASIPALLPVVRPFAAAGRLTLTRYLGHIFTVLAYGAAIALGAAAPPSLSRAAALCAEFFVAAATGSAAWSRFSRTGPLEAAMRRLTG